MFILKNDPIVDNDNIGYNENMDQKIFNVKRKELITLAEAEELDLAKATTLKERIKAGTLTGIKKGKTWFVVKEDVKKQRKN